MPVIIGLSALSLKLMYCPQCFAPRSPHVAGHLGCDDALAPFHTRLMPENLRTSLHLFPNRREEDIHSCTVQHLDTIKFFYLPTDAQ